MDTPQQDNSLSLQSLNDPDGDVEVVLSPEEKFVVQSTSLTANSEFFRAGLKDPWFANKLTGIFKTVNGNNIAMKRYKLDLDHAISKWCLVGDGNQVTNRSNVFPKTDALANQNADSTAGVSLSLVSAIRVHKFVFGLLLFLPLGKLRLAIGIDDLPLVMSYFDMMILSVDARNYLEHLLLYYRPFCDNIPIRPCQHMVFATMLKSERLYEDALNYAAGRAVVDKDSSEGTLDWCNLSMEGGSDRASHALRIRLGSRQLENGLLKLELALRDISLNPGESMADFVIHKWSEAFRKEHLGTTMQGKVQKYREFYAHKGKLFETLSIHRLLAEWLSPADAAKVALYQQHKVPQLVAVLESHLMEFDKEARSLCATLFRDRTFEQIEYDIENNAPLTGIDLDEIGYPWDDPTN